MKVGGGFSKIPSSSFCRSFHNNALFILFSKYHLCAYLFLCTFPTNFIRSWIPIGNSCISFGESHPECKLQIGYFFFLSCIEADLFCPIGRFDSFSDGTFCANITDIFNKQTTKRIKIKCKIQSRWWSIYANANSINIIIRGSQWMQWRIYIIKSFKMKKKHPNSSTPLQSTLSFSHSTGIFPNHWQHTFIFLNPHLPMCVRSYIYMCECVCVNAM